MLDYAALVAFAAVLRTGSFDAAAQILGVTQSAVSQRVKALEERLGCNLVQRTHPGPAQPKRAKGCCATLTMLPSWKLS